MLSLEESTSASDSFWQFLGGADNVTATLVALVVIWGAVRGLMRRTVIRRYLFRRALDSLGVGTNAAYVESLVGAATFGSLDSSESGKMVWALRYGYLAVVFSEGRSCQFAFTQTDPRLKYALGHQTFGHIRGRLGKPIRHLPEMPQGVYGDVGAHRFWFVETYYVGNPGGYLYFSLAHNDASRVGEFPFAFLREEGPLVASGIYSGQIDAQGDSVPIGSSEQRGFVPNTLIVSSDTDLLERHEFGVDADVVRLIRSRALLRERFRQWKWRRVHG